MTITYIWLLHNHKFSVLSTNQLDGWQTGATCRISNMQARRAITALQVQKIDTVTVMVSAQANIQRTNGTTKCDSVKWPVAQSRSTMFLWRKRNRAGDENLIGLGSFPRRLDIAVSYVDVLWRGVGVGGGDGQVDLRWLCRPRAAVTLRAVLVVECGVARCRRWCPFLPAACMK